MDLPYDHPPATHCNTLQHTATHCTTLHHTATHCNAMQHTATHCNALQHTATHCNTLQHTATHFNIVTTLILWRWCMCDMTPSYVWYDSLLRLTWHIHVCNTTDSYVTCLIYMCDHDSLTIPGEPCPYSSWNSYVTCLIHIHKSRASFIFLCDTLHSYATHFIHRCNHDSLTISGEPCPYSSWKSCVTCLIHIHKSCASFIFIWDTLHSYVWP